MTENKQPDKLYELSGSASAGKQADQLSKLEECLEMLEGTNITADLHQDYLGLLEELKQSEDDFIEKVDSIFSLIQSRKAWLEIRSFVSDRNLLSK